MGAAMEKDWTMKQLTDYVHPDILLYMQNAFSSVAELPIRICGPGDEPLVRLESKQAWDEALMGVDVDSLKRRPRSKAEPLTSPVIIDDRVACRIRLDTSVVGEKCESYHPKLLRLMARVMSRFAVDGKLYRQRTEQLLGLQRVTAEIAMGMDIRKVLQTVTDTVVEVLSGKSATVRLLHQERQELMVLARCGLSKEYLNKGQILLSDSEIDQLALSSATPIEISDLANDPRVLYPKAAAEEGLVSGLCAPMIYKGRSIGVLRVYTGVAHSFDWFEKQLLMSMASAAAAAVIHARRNKQAKDSWEIRHQLQTASEVQQGMIPQGPPKLDGFDIRGAYIPSQKLSGDFYDYLPMGDHSLGIAVADVVGKGIKAALLMASLRASLRAHAANVFDMQQVLDKVNRDLCHDSLISDFATMCYGVIDAQKLQLTYSCAGHLPPILVRDGTATELETGGGLLGIMDTMTYPIDTVQLKPGDVLLIYTDGLCEATNFKGEEFGRARVRETLLEAVALNMSAEKICAHCLWVLRGFAGLNERNDDRTLVAVRVL